LKVSGLKPGARSRIGGYAGYSCENGAVTGGVSFKEEGRAEIYNIRKKAVENPALQ